MKLKTTIPKYALQSVLEKHNNEEEVNIEGVKGFIKNIQYCHYNDDLYNVEIELYDEEMKKTSYRKSWIFTCSDEEEIAVDDRDGTLAISYYQSDEAPIWLPKEDLDGFIEMLKEIQND